MKILEILTPKRLIGNIGERAAARLLRKGGYKILQKNYAAFDAEIDIIAIKDGTVAFVEVKTRTLGHEDAREARPASAVNPEKQRKIIKCSKAFMSVNYQIKAKMRFDIIEVFLDENKKVAEIKHLISAFNYNTAF